MANAVAVISGLISLGFTVWFLVFTVFILIKLNKIIFLLDKNK